MENIIECKNITLAYGGAVVVKDLSFDVRRGEILLISGENGSGKSTLIKALLGLIRPVSGKISVESARRGGIGYLPQKSAAERDFPATVREVVSSGLTGSLRCGIFKPKGSGEKINSAMALARVAELSSRSFNELSGGQQQRTLLARALCAAEELLILDEPTNALDPASSAEMYSIITSLRHHHGMTVIMVSHDLESAVTMADSVLHLCCDGAFCCNACDYDKYLSAAHEGHIGVCSCGHDHHHDEKHDEKHDRHHGEKEETK